ncbi:hypothetical protein HU200_003497 [Digitaria exilis]|uniref:Uncharacterized protein n=1 Tax=Digitaria exilis TaxID=1010633 RepID=A0A835FWZ1_9POAL|nr:hypothetical protein HU200_003497 [Digitaria exilis]
MDWFFTFGGTYGKSEIEEFLNTAK